MEPHTFERARTFLLGAFRMFGNGLEEIWKLMLAHKKASAAVILGAIVLFAGFSFLIPKGLEDESDTRREVTVVRAGDLSGREPLTMIGEVRSISEALVAPDISGTIVGVYRSLGDVVGAGSIIAELKNDTQKAAVLQARAALEKAKSGTDAGSLGITNAETSYKGAEESALATMQTAIATIYDAVRRKADAVFSEPESNQPKIIVTVSNSQIGLNAENRRLSMRTILARHATLTLPTSGNVQIVELEQLVDEVGEVQAFLSTLNSALSGAVSNPSVTDAQIALYRGEISGALASVNALRSALTGTIELLQAKRSAIDIAKKNLALNPSGESADVLAAEANLSSALAQLEKTIIRAPISGTINRLDLEVGNFVNASVPVVYITNTRGLEVVAYVAARDLADIQVGAPVTIAGLTSGTVVRKAQALDPATKKAEIRVGISGNPDLVSGQSVTIEVAREGIKNDSVTLSIPIAAVKITSEGPVVFSVSELQTLVEHPVTLGTLRGAKVDIESGISADLMIVEDARGLKAREEVLIIP